MELTPSPVMRTFDEVAKWCAFAEAECGDPAEPVGLVFAKYVSELQMHQLFGGEVFCRMSKDEFQLWLSPEYVIPIGISKSDRPDLDAEGRLVNFAVSKIREGLWSLSPSLNMSGLIHAFVVLYDVPNRPPWESLVTVP